MTFNTLHEIRHFTWLFTGSMIAPGRMPFAEPLKAACNHLSQKLRSKSVHNLSSVKCQNLASRSTCHYIYMHSDVMRQLNVAYGGPAAVFSCSENNGTPCIGLARLFAAQEGTEMWDKLNRSKVVTCDKLLRLLTDCELPSTSSLAVSIYPLVDIVPNARFLRLRPAATQSLKSFFSSDSWHVFLKAYLNDAILSENVPFSVRYFGQTVVLLPVDIDPSDLTTAEECANSELPDKMSDLNVNDTILSVAEEQADNSKLESSSLDDSTAASIDHSPTKFVNSNKQQHYIMPPWGDSVNKLMAGLFVRVTSDTKVIFDHSGLISAPENGPGFSEIGGLTSAINILTTCILSVLERSQENNVAHLKIDNSIGNCHKSISGQGARNFLIYGPTGCGKTLILNALCMELRKFASKAKFVLDLNETDKSASLLSNNDVLIFDNMDSLIGSNNDPMESGGASKISKVMMKLLDDTYTFDQPKFLLCATSAPERLSTSLRRRFDIEIETPPPSAEERVVILDRLLKKCALADKIDGIFVDRIARDAHGYTGADLSSAVRQCISFSQSAKSSAPTASDLRSALNRTRPSALREITLEVPHVKWSDIGGYEDVKVLFRQAVEWPFTHPEAFIRLGARPPAGILLYGPPGCCKTLMARALATESQLNFLAVKGPELFSKWVGESERAVRRLFAKARQAAPAIIFFDEIDAIGVRRGGDGGGVLTQLLTEMDGLESLAGVTVIGATNRPETIDGALVRPGRLDRAIYVPLPDDAARKAIIEICLKTTPTCDDFNADWFVAETNGYSGAEIVSVFREAALSAMRRDFDAVKCVLDDFTLALSVIVPRTDMNALKVYESFAKCDV